MRTDRCVAIEKRPVLWYDITPSALPLDPGQRHELERDLLNQFKNWLSPEFSSVLDKPAHDKTDEEVHALNSKFDVFLIRVVAEPLGPRLLLLDSVVRRLMQWNDQTKNGAALWKKFTAAVLRGMEARTGSVTASLDPGWHQAKKELLKELRALQRQLRMLTGMTSRSLDWSAVQLELLGQRSAFPRLFQNLPSLGAFCKSHPETARGLASGDETPAEFFNQWGAWSTNRDPESFRQAVSKVGHQKEPQLRTSSRL